MPKESRADRALSAVLRPFAKVEPSEAGTASVLTVAVSRTGDELDGRAALFFGVAIP